MLLGRIVEIVNIEISSEDECRSRVRFKKIPAFAHDLDSCTVVGMVEEQRVGIQPVIVFISEAFNRRCRTL